MVYASAMCSPKGNRRIERIAVQTSITLNVKFLVCQKKGKEIIMIFLQKKKISPTDLRPWPWDELVAHGKKGVSRVAWVQCPGK